MNHNFFLKLPGSLTSFFTKLLLILLVPGIIMLRQTDTYADEITKDTAGTCIGVGGTFGYYNVNHKYGDEPAWDPGYGFGGGIVFESMLTDVFGIHSGIWYSRYTLGIKFSEKSEEENDPSGKFDVKSEAFTLPFYLISSLNSKYFIFNLLTGFNFTYISKSRMEQKSDGETNSEDIKKYLSYGQLGAGGGIEVLFRLTRFTRIFVACLGEYYFTDLIKEAGDTSDFLYDFKINTGFMVCTF